MIWNEVSLGYISDFQGGSQPPKSAFIDKPRTGYVRLLQIRDFKSDEKAVYIPESKKNRTCEDADIMIGRYGASVGQIHRGKSGAYNVALIRTIPDLDRIDRDFFYYYLISRLFQESLSNVSARSAQAGFSKADIADFVVPLPCREEQKRVVAILDEAFAGIDQAITNTEKNIHNARELFESYRDNIFIQNGEEWVESTLDNICGIKHGFAFKSEFFVENSDHVVLTPGSFFEWGGFRDQGKKTKYYSGVIPDGYLLKQGDFLIAMTEQAVGLLGSSLIVPESNTYLHNQRLGLVEILGGVSWDNDFFFHQFNTKEFRSSVQETATGIKVRHTSPTKLGNISVCYPHITL